MRRVGGSLSFFVGQYQSTVGVVLVPELAREVELIFVREKRREPRGERYDKI